MSVEAELNKIRENQEGHNMADADYQKKTDVRMEKQDGVLNLIKEGVEQLHEKMGIIDEQRTEKLDSIAVDVKETKIQAQKTNGRVTVLEDKTQEHESHLVRTQELAEKNQELANQILVSYKVDKTRIWTAISVLVFLGGAIITLAVMAIDSKIKDGIDTAVEEKLEK